MKGKDYFSGRLFEGPSEKEEERIVDEEGNIYDEKLNLIKEAPSEGLLLARKTHPDWSDQELAPLAAFFQKQIEVKRKQKEKEERKKKTKKI